LTKYKINPEEWERMSDDEKICEIISAFILEKHEELDDEIVEEAKATREILHRQKKGNDNLSEKLNHKEIRDSFSSTTLENEDTGEIVKAKIGFCPFCYDSTDKKKQFVMIDKNNYFCFLCYKYKAKSKFMKHWVKDGLKYMQKLDKYPGEMLPDAIRQLEEESSSSKQIAEIRSIIYDPSPMLIEFVSDLRNTNTYKSYPNQISDENKLIFTLYRILQCSDYKYSDSKPLFHLDPSTSTSEVADDEFHAFIKSGKI
jgi:hypothetical protein